MSIMRASSIKLSSGLSLNFHSFSTTTAIIWSSCEFNCGSWLLTRQLVDAHHHLSSTWLSFFFHLLSSFIANSLFAQIFIFHLIFVCSLRCMPNPLSSSLWFESSPFGYHCFSLTLFHFHHYNIQSSQQLPAEIYFIIRRLLLKLEVFLCCSCFFFFIVRLWLQTAIKWEGKSEKQEEEEKTQCSVVNQEC